MLTRATHGSFATVLEALVTSSTTVTSACNSWSKLCFNASLSMLGERKQTCCLSTVINCRIEWLATFIST